jgi:hypothetical protein
MAPVKFDDLNKVAKSVLSDDYINMGSPFQFKAKQKVCCGTVTTTVDLNQQGKEGGNSTSGVVSWKLSNPLGITGLAVDKFEYNKSGGMKFEGTVNKSIHKVDGLAVEFKTDLTDPLGKLKKGITYTGLADTQVKFETAVLKPDAFTAEVTRVQGPATIGAKVAGTNVDVGLRVSMSGLFASLVVTKGFQEFEGAAHYKVNNTLEVAALAKKGKAVSVEGGIKFALNDALTLKAKATDKGVATALATYKPAKGFTVHSGATFGEKVSYGLQLNIE